MPRGPSTPLCQASRQGFLAAHAEDAEAASASCPFRLARTAPEAFRLAEEWNLAVGTRLAGASASWPVRHNGQTPPSPTRKRLKRSTHRGSIGRGLQELPPDGLEWPAKVVRTREEGFRAWQWIQARSSETSTAHGLPGAFKRMAGDDRGEGLCVARRNRCLKSGALWKVLAAPFRLLHAARRPVPWHPEPLRTWLLGDVVRGGGRAPQAGVAGGVSRPCCRHRGRLVNADVTGRRAHACELPQFARKGNGGDLPTSLGKTGKPIGGLS